MELLSAVVGSNRAAVGPEEERRKRLRRRVDVQRDAPRYSGNTDLEAYWKRVQKYLRDAEICEDREKLIIISNALEGRAAEYLGAVDSPGDTAELYVSLRKRFGKTRF